MSRTLLFHLADLTPTVPLRSTQGVPPDPLVGQDGEEER